MDFEDVDYLNETFEDDNDEIDNKNDKDYVPNPSAAGKRKRSQNRGKTGDSWTHEDTVKSKFVPVYGMQEIKNTSYATNVNQLGGQYLLFSMVNSRSNK